MRDEISAAVVFLTRLVRKNEHLSDEQVKEFSSNLSKVLTARFKNHWYQDAPTKGQGYRCIRVNETDPTDPVLVKAATDSGLKYCDLNLPTELTLWVDPCEVCCRFGEMIGSYCVLATFKEGNKENKVTSVNLDDLLEKGNTHSNETLRTTRLSPFTKSNIHSIGNNKLLNSTKLRNNIQNYENRQNMVKGPGHIHQKSKPFHPKQLQNNPKYSGVAKYPSFHGPKKDRFHWVRGADLIKTN